MAVPALTGTPEQKAWQALPVAKAWVANAIRRMGANSEGARMITWFGYDDASTRAEVKKVLSCITDALAVNGVTFHTPWAECERDGYLAWVLPGEKDYSGKYIINICEKATSYGCDACVVATIAHETSHHCGTKDHAYDLPSLKAHAAEWGTENAENIVLHQGRQRTHVIYVLGAGVFI